MIMKKIALLILLLVAISFAKAQPANDEPCNALVLPIIENVDGCTMVTYNITGATYTNIPNTFACNPNPDVWLRFNTPDIYLKLRFGGNVNFSTYTYSNCSSNLSDNLLCIDSVTWANANNIVFASNVNQLIRIESSNGSPNFSFSICVGLLRPGADARVGIHTKLPQSNFDVAGKAIFRDTLSVNKTFRFNNGTEGPNRVLTSDNNGYANWGNPPTNYWTTSGTNIYNNNTGNVGIGNTTPSNKLSVTGNANFSGNLGIGNATPTRPLSFPASLGEKILLYPGGIGEVGIGVYGNELRLHADNPGAKISFGTQTNAGVFTEAGKFEIAGGYALSVFGNIWANGVTYNSDARFKKNIHPLNNSLQKLMQLKGVEYEMITDKFSNKNFMEGTQIGLLAQEVEAVVPQVVSTNADGYKSVDYAKLVPLLIEGMKEQQKQIDKLQQEINNLKKNN